LKHDREISVQYVIQSFKPIKTHAHNEAHHAEK